jgi:hypothetical protein
MEKEQQMTEYQKKLQWEFEVWLLENVVGIPDDGNPLSADEMFDPAKMFVYRMPVNNQDRLFLVKMAEIPSILRSRMGI